MYVGLKNIQHLFSSMSNLLTNTDGRHCLTGWTKWSEAPALHMDHLLYTCTADDDIRFGNLTENIHMLYIAQTGSDLQALADQFPKEISLLLVEAEDVSAVYTNLQNYFNSQCGIGMFGQTLLEFLSFEDGLQEAVEYSCNVLHNPIFVFDGGYNLVAATWEAIRELNIDSDVVINKGFTKADFKMADRHNLHSHVMKSEIPIQAYNEELGYDQLYCSINTQKNLGHIVVSAINRPFKSPDSEMLLVLKKFIDLQMRKDSFIHNSRGFNYEYFLKDLLDKKIAAPRSELYRMQYVSSEFSGNMYCMVFELARSVHTMNPVQVRNMIESRFPHSKVIIYNGQVVCIINIFAKQLISPEYLETARRFCQENGLYAGLSNCFQDILSFEEYYKQALRSIELGVCSHAEPDLFFYKDYYLEHILNIFTLNESPEVFCHPKMKLLLEYDEAHHSELAYTLYMYLTHERNLVATAEAMEMHRTSLVYRFKKINSLLQDDFDDYKDRLWLILSYEMNQPDIK